MIRSLRNSTELYGTPRDSARLHETPWDSMGLRGTPLAWSLPFPPWLVLVRALIRKGRFHLLLLFFHWFFHIYRFFDHLIRMFNYTEIQIVVVTFWNSLSIAWDIELNEIIASFCAISIVRCHASNWDSLYELEIRKYQTGVIFETGKSKRLKFLLPQDLK
jgi:hypothetical protein